MANIYGPSQLAVRASAAICLFGVALGVGACGGTTSAPAPGSPVTRAAPSGGGGVGCNAKPSPGVDLSGCNLAGYIYDYGNFTGANLSGANLEKASLRWSDLTGANLTGANLTDARLDDAKGCATVIGADLSGRC